MTSSSFWFIFTSIIGGHHHPDIYHAHDRFRDDPDWGLHQLDTMRDRYNIIGLISSQVYTNKVKYGVYTKIYPMFIFHIDLLPCRLTGQDLILSAKISLSCNLVRKTSPMILLYHGLTMHH